MKKSLAGLALAGLVTFGSAPIAMAQTQPQVQPAQQTTVDTESDDSGKWGLLGLLGLLGLGGLAGLKRRDRYDDRTRVASGTTTR
jgi:MYXO-CTERM domain-containing protein